MEQLKSANAWLIENYPSGPMDGLEYVVAMERYANYKTKYLQGSIIGFRMMVNHLFNYSELDYEHTMNDLDNFLKFYDKHFNIVELRNGDSNSTL